MTDSVLIVGSGLAGLTAAQDCADAGANVIIVERAAVAGGRFAAAATDDSAAVDGIAVPKLAALSARDNVELIVLAELEALQGRPGNFTATITEQARFVTDTCTRCNRCRAVCPSVSPNEFDEGLTYRKAIYTPLAETCPPEYVIDIDSCLNRPPNYLPCNRCIEVCDDDSIHFDLPLQTTHQRTVATVIVATGCDNANGTALQDRGYGTHPDIVTTAELQRMLLAPGPTGGFVAKPSNEEYPDSILLTLDQLTPYALDATASLVRQLLAQNIERVAVLVTQQPPADASLAVLPAGSEICFGMLRKIEGQGSSVMVSWADFGSNRLPQEQFDLVVLDAGAQPAAGMDRLAATLQLELTPEGFAAAPVAEQPWASSQPGIYLAGSVAGPVAAANTVRAAKAAALAALGQLDPRLLRADFVPGVAEEQHKIAAQEDALRERIERALYALLDRSG
ncbi:MAG: FAD-binding protein [Gammaproteobacteria bacterium]|nr:FAD-binding protein [Gammaproteobacteria bacterium]NNF62397.1 CoB--CoM heterodisulfide reductase iron-sulfur subunit A family protein [Gammaproteobacteria bacterium]NNM20913.1 CoB--CoM heterodisulfide reductase iron-sulfur subunit A family protein [Gammaproteobacteria bacterium]